MPDLDGAFALYLYPDMAVPRLVVADETTLAAFVNALGLYRWTVEHGSASVSEKSFPLPPEPGAVPKATVRVPGTRAPHKTAAKKAAKTAPTLSAVDLKQLEQFGCTPCRVAHHVGDADHAGHDGRCGCPICDPTLAAKPAADTASTNAAARAAAKSSATIASMTRPVDPLWDKPYPQDDIPF